MNSRVCINYNITATLPSKGTRVCTLTSLQETDNPLLTCSWCLVSYFRYTCPFWLVERTPSYTPGPGMEQPREAQEQTCTEQGECTAGALTRHTWSLCLETGKGNMRFLVWDPLLNVFQAAISSNRKENKSQTCSSWNFITFSRWKHNIRGELQIKQQKSLVGINSN